MTDLAPHVAAFLREHLPHERRFSRHTVQSYTESFKLLVLHVSARLDIRLLFRALSRGIPMGIRRFVP